MNMERPDDDEVLNEVIETLDLDEAAADALRLSIMETHEKADTLVARVHAIGHELSIEHDGEIYVNLAWLATLLLIEGEQTMRGHGGCADHLRVVDWIETTVVAATKNVEKLDTE